MQQRPPSSRTLGARIVKNLVGFWAPIELLAGSEIQPVHGPDRAGDVKHSMADITKANKLLQYKPLVSTEQGLKKTFDWYKQKSEVKV